MRSMCVKVSMGNIQIATIPAKTGNSYKTIPTETESPELYYQGCLPGFETISEEGAADCFDLTVAELRQLYESGNFPDPAFCEDDSARWWFWELVLWAFSGCPPVAEWDAAAALEVHRDFFRRALRMHLERLADSVRVFIGEIS